MYWLGTDVAPVPQTKIGCLRPFSPIVVGWKTQLLAPPSSSTVTSNGPSSAVLITGGSVPPIGAAPPVPAIMSAPALPPIPALPPVPPLSPPPLPPLPAGVPATPIIPPAGMPPVGVVPAVPLVPAPPVPAPALPAVAAAPALPPVPAPVSRLSVVCEPSLQPRAAIPTRQRTIERANTCRLITDLHRPTLCERLTRSGWIAGQSFHDCDP